MDKKFIYCNDIETKNRLLSMNLPLLKQGNGFFVFANIESKHMKFKDIENKVMFTNKMQF